MRHFIAFIALVFTLAFSHAAFAKILNIQEVTSPAGFRIWMVEDHSLPVVALTFGFHTGSAIDAPEFQGVSQLLSNTLDEGAADMTSTEFQTLLRDNAIDLSFSATRDGFFGSMRTLTRHLPKAETLLRTAIMAPRFDDEAVARMKAANIARIKSSLSDADWIAARLLNEAMYKGHPYSMNSGGTLQSLSRLTGVELRAARASHFARSNLVVGITGDITPEQAGFMVDMLFTDLPHQAPEEPIEDMPIPVAEKPLYYARDIPQTSLSMAWQGLPIDDPDHYVAVVMNYIFGGGGFSSRLMEEVREKRGLTYGIYSSEYNLDHADRLVVSASLLPGNVVPAIDMIKAVARDMATTPVSAETLKAAQDYLVGSLPLAFSSTGRTAAALVDLQMDRRLIDTLDTYREKIMWVTADDIQRIAARVFAAEPIIVTAGAKPVGLDVTVLTTLPNTETVTYVKPSAGAHE